MQHRNRRLTARNSRSRRSLEARVSTASRPFPYEASGSGAVAVKAARSRKDSMWLKETERGRGANINRKVSKNNQTERSRAIALLKANKEKRRHNQKNDQCVDPRENDKEKIALQKGNINSSVSKNDLPKESQADKFFDANDRSVPKYLEANKDNCKDNQKNDINVSQVYVDPRERGKARIALQEKFIKDLHWGQGVARGFDTFPLGKDGGIEAAFNRCEQESDLARGRIRFQDRTKAGRAAPDAGFMGRFDAQTQQCDLDKFKGLKINKNPHQGLQRKIKDRNLNPFLI
eukprot:g6242.t1